MFFKTSSHKTKRPSVFFLLSLFFLIVFGHIHIRGPPKSFGDLGRIAIYFQTVIRAGEHALKLVEL